MTAGRASLDNRLHLPPPLAIAAQHHADVHSQTHGGCVKIIDKSRGRTLRVARLLWRSATSGDRSRGESARATSVSKLTQRGQPGVSPLDLGEAEVVAGLLGRRVGFEPVRPRRLGARVTDGRRYLYTRQRGRGWRTGLLRCHFPSWL